MMTIRDRIRFAAKSFFVLALVGSVIMMFIGGGFFWYFSRALPNIITVEDYKPAVVSQVVTEFNNQRTVIGEFFKEKRYLISYEKMPEKLIQAFISAEDDQFFNHQGVNLVSIIRAAIVNFKAGHVVQGGSTITQQVAKSLLLTPERSFVRKAKELLLANQIERNLSKKQILYLYLNQIYLGHGAHGVQAASKVYFNKDAFDLSIAEAALIAGMPQAPGKFSPHLNPKKAKERQAYVLRRMFENKYISKVEYDTAINERLRIYENTDPNPKHSPYFVENLRRYLLDKYGETALYEEGLTIVLNVDPTLLQNAGRALKEGLRIVDKRLGYRGPIKRLKTAQDIEKEKEKNRRELILKELGYEVLMPTGELNVFEGVSLAGFTSESDLLRPTELYKAIVIGTNAAKSTTQLQIGEIKIEMPFSESKWARTSFSKGDQIFVKIKREGTAIIASLEQEPDAQAALFSMDVKTGQVLAIEGGYDFSKSEFNRATQAQRQMGSSFKPLIFASALENGYTPVTLIVDAPIVYNDEEFGKWKPTNYDEKFYGDTTFRQALIKSRNIPTIKIVQDIKVSTVLDFAKRLGIKAEFEPNLSTALGSATVSLSELTRAYAVFPRFGRTVDPIYFNRVEDRIGNVLEEQKHVELPPLEKIQNEIKKAYEAMSIEERQNQKAPLTKLPLESDVAQVLDPRVAYVSTHLMKEVVNFGTGHEAKQLGRPAAGKTGTTNDYQDAWFVGFTPQVVTGVWVGYDTSKTIGSGETGAKAALPIWLEFMKEAVKNQPSEDFPIPEGVVFASINPLTGQLGAANSANTIKEAFIEGTQPTEQNLPTQNKATTRSTGDFLKEDIE
jgi:penicillin-binding protein 1A